MGVEPIIPSLPLKCITALLIQQEISEVGFEPTWAFASRLRVYPNRPNSGHSPKY